MTLGSDAPGASAPSNFHDTRWTVIRAAAGGFTESGVANPAARAALAQLCRDYWYPLYAYLRRREFSRHDAQDLTQDFFVHLLDGRLVRQADAHRGRFRAFLLTALENFVRDERDRRGAQRRGGGHLLVSYEEIAAGETRCGAELPSAARVAPGEFFETQWAGALVDAALDRLRDDLVGRGRAAVFDRLKPFLTGGEDHPSECAAVESLGLSPGALRTSLHRLRRQYGQLLRAEVVRTVASPEDVDGELRHLCAVLARRTA